MRSDVRAAMAPRPVLDLSHLSPYTFGAQSTVFWGMLGMILIESVVFATLIASYFYLRAQAVAWPPPGTDPPALTLPTLNTLVLLLSSLVLHWGDTGIRQGNQQRLAWGLFGAALLGTVFLVLKVVEYSSVEYRWDTHAYGSIVWLIIGFHSAHVLTLLLKTVVVDTLAFRRYFTKERRIGVTVNGIYWHFVVLVWLPLYAVIYLVPRV